MLEFIQIGRGERERDSCLAEALSIVRSLIPVAELGIGVLQSCFPTAYIRCLGIVDRQDNERIDLFDGI